MQRVKKVTKTKKGGSGYQLFIKIDQSQQGQDKGQDHETGIHNAGLKQCDSKTMCDLTSQLDNFSVMTMSGAMFNVNSNDVELLMAG